MTEDSTTRHAPASMSGAAGDIKPSEQTGHPNSHLLFQKRLLLPLLIIFLVSFAGYYRAISNGFVYDDNAQVVENFWIRDFGYLPKIFFSDVWKFYGEGASNYYRPIMHIIYTLNYHLFGLVPWGFHLVNILFHAGVAIMLFFIATKLLNKSRSHPLGQDSPKEKTGSAVTPELMIALLFALHPVNTEAVTWVACLPELTFSFFYLLSLYLYMEGPDGCKPSMRTLLISSACFFVAALSKETALTLPIVLVVYDGIFTTGHESLICRIKRYFPYLLVTFLYFGLRLYSLDAIVPVRRHPELNAFQCVLNVFPLFSQYLEKLLLPVNLSAYYVFHPITTLLTARGIFSLAVTAAFFGFAVFAATKKYRVALFCLALIVIPLLPVLYIPALGENSFAERYLYVPSAGFSLLIGLGIQKAIEHPWRKRAILSSICLILCLYSLGTVLRIPVWKDNYSLWSDTLPKASDGAIPHSLMGDVFLEMGQYNKAVEQYKIALQLKPDYVDAHTNLGAAYKSLGLTDQAVKELQTAIALKPGSAIAHSSLGSIYSETGLMDKALVELQTALKFNPYLPGAYVSLGEIYSSKGMMEEAIKQFQKGLRLNPDFADGYNNLGIVYAKAGEFNLAIEQFEIATRLKPNDPTFFYNTAKAYKALGNTDKYEYFIRKAKQIGEPQH